MFVIYIYDPFGTILTQIFSVNNLKISQKLNDIWTASFSIFLQDENAKYEYFKEMNRVRISQLYIGEEKEIFSGIIQGANVSFERVEVLMSDENYVFKKKKLYTNKTYTWVSISSILSEILWEMNTRYASWITLDCSISDLVTKDYKAGKSYLEIFKDLAENGYEFQLKNNILFFWNTIWQDRTSGPNFVEFLYDKNDILGKNIDSASSSYNADNISNAIIISWVGNIQDITSINTFTRLEEYFSSGDLVKILDERKESIREIDITPSTEDFFLCDIWDVVKVYINSWSDMLSYDGNMKVIEKTFTSWDLNTINVKLSTNKVKTLTLLEKISEINNRVGNLEL